MNSRNGPRAREQMERGALINFLMAISARLDRPLIAPRSPESDHGKRSDATLGVHSPRHFIRRTR
jgi:hypothetical protein